MGVVGVSSGFNAGKVACLVRDNSDIKTVAKFDPKLFYLMESQLRSVVCPVVYEEGMFAYIGGMLYNENGYVSYWAILAVVVAAGLLYFYREKMCGDKGKYQPLLEQESAYGSTVYFYFFCLMTIYFWYAINTKNRVSLFLFIILLSF